MKHSANSISPKSFGFIVFLLFNVSCLVSCKKKSNLENNNLPNPADSVVVALKASTESELSGVGFFEDLDTALIPPFARLTYINEWEIPNLPTPGDQGQYNTCVGWTLAHGMLSYDYRLIEGSNFTGSPGFMWGKLNLFNEGISLATGLKFLKEQGSCDVSFHGPFKYIYPNEHAIGNALKHTIAEYYQFKTFDIGKIKSMIAGNFPLPFGIKVDVGFARNKAIKFNFPKPDPLSYDTEPDGRFVYRRKSGREYVDGHCMLLVGYDDKIKAFKAMNSWGKDWGNDGFVWIDYELFESSLLKTGNIFGSPDLYWTYPQTVTTNPVTSIKTTSAKCGGHVVTGGGLEVKARGVCWSTSNKPTIANAHSTDGSGLGVFVSNITGLSPNTKYYVRSYVRLSSGLHQYGWLDSFTTKDMLLSINIQSGNNQTGLPNNNLPNPLVVLVKDENNNGQLVAAINVSWTITSGGGQLASSLTTTSSSGQANNIWKLGASGTQTVEASVKKADGSHVIGSPLFFSATIGDIDSTEIYKANMVGNWIVETHNNINTFGWDIVVKQYKTLDAAGKVFIYQEQYYYAPPNPNPPMTFYSPPRLQESWTIVRKPTGYHLKIISQYGGETLKPLTYPIGSFWFGGPPTAGSGAIFYTR